MSKIFPFLILLILFSCKESKQLNDKVEFNKLDSVYFRNFKAENSKFSLLIFGGAYFNSKLVVTNCQELKPEDSVQTLKLGPFAKIFRIDKSCKTSVVDEKRKHYLEFNADSVKKYKFIYVTRELESDSLIVEFTNNHKPVL